MSNDFPLINGVYHSSAEAQLVLAAYGGGSAFKTADLYEFNFEEKLEPADVPGLGGAKRGTTEGVYSTTGSISLYLDAHAKFAAELAIRAKAMRIKLGAVQFGIQGSYRATPGAALRRFQAQGCRITTRTLEGGTDASPTSIVTPLNITKFRIDGNSLGEIPK